jgi:CheY-like chemotaxis protein
VTDFLVQEEATAELRERTTQMRVEILQRSQELHEANRRLRAANQARDEFLSRMSHELRTPLNAVLGFGQVLEIGPLDDDQRQSVEQILKAGRHLLGLIDEVLDIARIDSGNLAVSIEAVGIRHVVGETIDLIRPMARRQDIELLDAVGSAEEHVRADRQRLKQVLLNLASNAVKYNTPGGSVTFSFGRLDDGQIELRVTDTGRGIAPEHMDRVFTPFDRLGADQWEVEGTGIGLSLSKRLVELMGGKIGVTSVLNRGSTFTVTLQGVQSPLARTASASGATARRPARARPATLLYVEDNISNLKLIERVLSGRSVRLIAAMQGALGVELAREHRPDVILLDLHLPGMTGEEVLDQLRGDTRTSSIPVIVLSADATPGRIERLRSAGAEAYLTKPLDVAEFLGLLDRILDQRATA